MRYRLSGLHVFMFLALSLAAFSVLCADGYAKQRGLSDEAFQELSDSGVDQYLGQFEPLSSVPYGVWTKHTFDREFGPFGPNGPVCIAGTEYSVFTKAGDPDKLLIFLQGGGACWEGVLQCNVLAEDQFPPENGVAGGIFDPNNPDNPFADYSIVYLPYCDGSVFGGDNVVADANFPGGVRIHRGLRNLSAGMDVAADTFPNPKKITVAGSSAGGVGAAAFAPFLTRFVYGNRTDLTVFNDAGPIALDPQGRPDAAAARAADWDYGKFYPASCTECDPVGQQTAIVEWRLDNDSTIRESFYETDADGTNRGFASTNAPGPPVGFLTQSEYRDIVLTAHGALNRAHRSRYRTFIVSGDTTHTALQYGWFYTQDVKGVLLNEWTTDFLLNGDGDSQGYWRDLVESFIPAPF